MRARAAAAGRPAGSAPMTAGDRRPGPADSLPAGPGSGSLEQVRAEWICFYDDNYRRVVRFVILDGASLAEAQDAAQEAFIESWQLLNGDPARWQAVTGKGAWVRTVALRRHRRPPGPRRRPLTDGAGEVPDQAAPGPDPAELTVQNQAVLQALRSLDEEARTVMAFELDGFSPTETAEAMHLGTRRVWDAKKRARAALKRQLATAPAERRTP
jgi:DNA-directed RNA polymerase specialized sigma24 family protein